MECRTRTLLAVTFFFEAMSCGEVKKIFFIHNMVLQVDYYFLEETLNFMALCICMVIWNANLIATFLFSLAPIAPPFIISCGGHSKS
jgi:hypothetical protein